MAPSAIHLGTKEPAVLGDGVALNAAKWVAGAPPTAHTEQDAFGGGATQQKHISSAV